jgi:hypothetical protein
VNNYGIQKDCYFTSREGNCFICELNNSLIGVFKIVEDKEIILLRKFEGLFKVEGYSY